MKSLVVYSSKSGNTKKLAEAVCAQLPGEKFLEPIEESADSQGYDLVVVGFWLQGGKPDPIASNYLATLDQTTLFLLATHGATADSEHARKGMLAARELASSSRILGTFSCQGEVKPAFLAKAQSMTPPPPWIQDAAAAKGHPDNMDIDNALTAVQKIIPQIS